MLEAAVREAGRGQNLMLEGTTGLIHIRHPRTVAMHFFHVDRLSHAEPRQGRDDAREDNDHEGVSKVGLGHETSIVMHIGIDRGNTVP